MSDQIVPITPGSGANIDVNQVTTGAGTADRQRVQIGGNAGSDVADVAGGALLVSNLDLVLRQMLAVLGGLQIDPAGRQNVYATLPTTTAINSVSTVSTVSTVGNITSFGGQGAFGLACIQMDGLTTPWREHLT